MKRMSRVDSKAGIFQKENSLLWLKSFVSKSVFMMLTLITGLSTMSFNQDDTSANGIDTNLNTAKKEITIIAPKHYAETTYFKAPGYKKADNLSMPGMKAIAIADREIFRSFITELGVAKISMANFAGISIEADSEMKRNFVLSTLQPLANNSGKADLSMIDVFTNEVVSGSIMPAGNSSDAADELMAKMFMQENFRVVFAQVNSIDALISDSEMTDTFEEENGLSFRLPSRSQIEASDAEILKNYLHH